MKTIIKVKTWSCPDCQYRQDFDVNNQELMDINFPEGVRAGYCPACFLGKCPDGMKKEILMFKENNLDKKITITVMGEEDIETEITEAKDRKQRGKEDKNDPDVATSAKENVYRNKRKEDIRLATIEAKKYEDE